MGASKPSKSAKTPKKAVKKAQSLPDKEVQEKATPSEPTAVEGHFATENHFRTVVYRLLSDINEQTTDIAELLGGILKAMSNIQSQVDAITTELTTIEADLTAEYDALKTQVDAGTVPDLTNLSAIVAKFSADDAAWKQPVVVPPATGGGAAPTS